MLMTHKCRNCGHTVNDAQLRRSYKLS